MSLFPCGEATSLIGGGLSEWLMEPVLLTGNGASPAVQGFETLTLRHFKFSPVALTTGEKHSQAGAKERGCLDPSLFWLSDTPGARKMTSKCCCAECKKFGKDRTGNQRWRCKTCLKTFTEAPARLLGDMRINEDKAILALTLLVEGTSVRSIERITGLHRDSIIKLMVQTGERCERLMQDMIRDVPAKDIEADEMWGFVGMKERTKKRKGIKDDYLGDAYCFVGIERHTKLVHAWHLGRRTTAHTGQFLDKLDMAVGGDRFQINTDGFAGYADSIMWCLGGRADHGEIVKNYADTVKNEARYSAPEVIGVTRTARSGKPERRIGTSRIERQNLTMRQRIRRLTRLTLGFSKKWENLKAAIALHFAFYNLCTIHRTIRCTPAMEAKVTDHIWTMGELLAAGATQ